LPALDDRGGATSKAKSPKAQSRRAVSVYAGRQCVAHVVAHAAAALANAGATAIADEQHPLKIVVERTASGKKWSATVNGRVVCVSAWPFVMAARVLLAVGHPADIPIEMWRPGAIEWALRGRLGAVAATIVGVETASRRAKKASPVRVATTGYVPAPSEHTRLQGPFLGGVPAIGTED
jgi:hypothetical protein